jgi:L-2-hydroxyglutarate oxidase LhgO
LPEVERDALYADYSGIRPKLAGPGEPFRDFIIEEESARGFPGTLPSLPARIRSAPLTHARTNARHVITGLVNLLGIESPGLTSSPAIAEYVAEKLGYRPCFQPDALTLHH